ncbi:hypothetical protein [Streptomyces mirabilis]|uniref:hypothetical protein n=1 Tax=Streptomyces mirabilis TaxID=68239 RepID=UPI0036D9933C
MMIGVDVGSGDRLALGVLTQYRMATTEQMHRVIAPSVRIEQQFVGVDHTGARRSAVSSSEGCCTYQIVQKTVFRKFLSTSTF